MSKYLNLNEDGFVEVIEIDGLRSRSIFTTSSLRRFDVLSRSSAAFRSPDAFAASREELARRLAVHGCWDSRVSAQSRMFDEEPARSARWLLTTVLARGWNAVIRFLTKERAL
jgi:hypothetical protein